MRKILLLLLAFVSLTLTLKAQTQSLEDLNPPCSLYAYNSLILK